MTAKEQVITEEIGHHETVDGALPSIESILAAADCRKRIASDTQLLGFLRTGEVIAEMAEGDTDDEWAYTAHSAAAEKFFSSNQKGN